MNKEQKPADTEWILPVGRSFVIGVGLLLVCVFLSGEIIQGVAWLFVGSRARDLMSGQNLSGEGDMMLFRVLAGLGNVLNWGVAGLIWAAFNGKALHQLRLKQKVNPLPLLLSALAVVASLPAMQALLLTPESFSLGGMHGLENWIEKEEAGRVDAIRSLLSSGSVGVLFANLLVIALIPAMAEEIFFRGALQRNLERVLPAHGAVWAAALLFSALHFQFLGFLPRLFLGAALGYAFQRTGSLWVSITAHFAFNAVNLLIGFLAVRGALPIAMLEPDFKFPWWTVAVSAVVSVSLLWLGLRKKQGVIS